jgi:hypothetical protein
VFALGLLRELRTNQGHALGIAEVTSAFVRAKRQEISMNADVIEVWQVLRVRSHERDRCK